FRFDVPAAGLDAVIAVEPGHARRHAPVGILAQGRAANTEIVVSARGPILQRDQKTVVLVHVKKARSGEWIQARCVLVLLARVNAGSSCITGANIEDKIRRESVRPGATVVSSFAAAGR